MYSNKKAWRSRAVLVLAVSVSMAGGLLLSGCGSTDGGEAADQTFGDDVFVGSDGNTGSIELKLPSGTIPVGGTETFEVFVRDVNGQPVPQIKVSCDSERGVAIVEPTTGTELTGQYGGISGVLGCRFPGSFQFGCRLPIGANKRKFGTIKCEGEVPAGFDGFPDASGGGLGTGGVSVNDDGEPGGDSISGVRVSNLAVFDVDETGTFGIDIAQNDDCNADGTQDDPEPFLQNLAELTLENNSNQTIRVVSMRFTVANVDGSGTGSYTSPSISANAEVGPNGDTASVRIPFTTFVSGGKAFIGRTTAITALFRNMTFTVRIRNQSGEEANISAPIGVDYQNFDNCSG